MKKDPYLKDLFANYNPPLSDDEEFLNNLTQRLDTIEPARRYYSRERRHLHRSLVVAFLTGIPVGAAMTVFLLFHPLALHFPVLWSRLPVLCWFARHGSLLLSMLIVLASAAGVAYFCTLFYNLFAFRSASSQQK